MPLINGQKMACAPCIRGHRSTKCNHASERVMVPVRKPGRPLSTCPCPPGKPCSCGSVKIAIPRKQTCHCGPGEEHDVVDHEIKSESSSTKGDPPSPTRAYRVQKSGSGKLNGRKASFDPANLDRIDPSSINILGQYGSMEPRAIPVNGASPFPAGAVNGLSFGPAIPRNGFEQANGNAFTTPLNYGVPMPQHLQQPGVSSTSLPPEKQAYQTRSPPSVPMPPPMTNGGSCCAPKQNPSPAPDLAQIPMSTPARSCCGGPKIEPTKTNGVTSPSQMAPPNATFPPVPDTLDMKQAQYAVSFSQPTIYTYPPNYGSWSHPVNAMMWAQMQPDQPAAFPYAQPIPMASTNGTSPVLEGLSHQCSCGPGCHCVGCLAHPFNHETLEYVGGAWDYDADDASSADMFGKGNANGLDHAASTAARTTHGQILHQNGMSSQDPQQQQQQPSSPQQAQTPSDTSAMSGEEQALSTSDYFFVNMPLHPGGLSVNADSCSGNEAFCPCGDDCQCDGCFVHNARPLGQFPG